MACCILAAFLLGQVILAWRWLRLRFGGTAPVPAALWSAAPAAAVDPPRQDRRRRTRGHLIAGVMSLCIAAGGVGAWGFGAWGGGSAIPHGNAAPRVWCLGELDE